jgi:hypothetical protein
MSRMGLAGFGAPSGQSDRALISLILRMILPGSQQLLGIMWCLPGWKQNIVVSWVPPRNWAISRCKKPCLQCSFCIRADIHLIFAMPVAAVEFIVYAE